MHLHIVGVINLLTNVVLKTCLTNRKCVQLVLFLISTSESRLDRPRDISWVKPELKFKTFHYFFFADFKAAAMS